MVLYRDANETRTMHCHTARYLQTMAEMPCKCTGKRRNEKCSPSHDQLIIYIHVQFGFHLTIERQSVLHFDNCSAGYTLHKHQQVYQENDNHSVMSGICCLPVCGICPLCPDSKLSSRLSIFVFRQAFSTSLERKRDWTLYLYTNRPAYTCVNGVCQGLSFRSLERFQPCKSHTLL